MAVRIIEPKRETKTGRLFHYCPINEEQIGVNVCSSCKYKESIELLPIKYRVHCAAPDTTNLFRPEPAKAYDSIGKLKALDVMKSENHIWVERKMDGVRAIVHATPNGVYITSRRRNKDGSYNQFQDNVPHLKNSQYLKAVGELGYTVFDAEVMVPILNEKTLPLTMGVVGSKPDRAINTQEENDSWLNLHIFDILYYKGSDIREFSFKHRRNVLNSLYADYLWHVEQKVILVPYSLCWNFNDKMQAYNNAIEEGFEGLVIKNPDSAYGESHAWLKVKGKVTVDAQIVGYEMGSVGGKYESTLGAFRVAAYNRHGKLIEIARVIPGDDLTREEMYGILKNKSEREILDLGLILEMEAQAWTVSEFPRLRHPRIVRYRPDRSEPNTIDFIG